MTSNKNYFTPDFGRNLTGRWMQPRTNQILHQSIQLSPQEHQQTQLDKLRTCTVEPSFKGTMSPGFCSFFVITVQIIQLVTLFHAQNVLFTTKGRYQVNFRIDTKVLLVLSDFSKTQQYNLKKLPQLFQIAIHFHPGHPQLKTLTDSLDTLM